MLGGLNRAQRSDDQEHENNNTQKLPLTEQLRRAEKRAQILSSLLGASLEWRQGALQALVHTAPEPLEGVQGLSEVARDTLTQAKKTQREQALNHEKELKQVLARCAHEKKLRVSLEV